MRIVITGVAGRLGVPLANRLAAEGHTIIGIDDLSASGDPRMLDEGVTFTRGDVRDMPRLWSLLAGADVVYHLAAKVSVPESILYPVEYDAVNTAGTVCLVTAARDAGVRRVVLASSGTVYGPQEAQPIPESAPPRPTNPYGVSKLAAEGYVRAIGDLYHIETVVLRIFNAYGSLHPIPPSHPPVIPYFARQILSGGSVVLHGVPPGGQTRDFVHVDDVVDALARAGQTGGLSGRTLNIGSGRETQIREVLAGLERAAGRSARVLESPEHSGGLPRMCADVSAAETALGWRPRVPLEEGLARLVEGLRRSAARA